jgi:hypothetical protein
MKRIIFISVVSALLCGGAVLYAREIEADARATVQKAVAAPIIHAPKAAEKKKPAASVMLRLPLPNAVAPPKTSAGVNLPVPFTSQAPYRVWDALHEETCEEADMFMVEKYFKKETISGPAEADAAFRKTIAWEKANIGQYKDTNADEIMTILRDYYGLKNVKLLLDPSVADIKNNLDLGYPILLPADGKELANPNFKNGGPPYHVVVLRGYTPDGHWITNDSGTRFGNGFLYPEQNLMAAMHDFVPGDTAHGRKVVIVVVPN